MLKGRLHSKVVVEVTDICISYRSTDEFRAETLVRWFRDVGWHVWSDKDVSVGVDYTEEILRRFAAAKCVVVIWGAEARRSDWVLREAALALEQDKLVQIQATGLPLPEPFDRINAVRMPAWSGEDKHSQKSTLLAAVASKLGVAMPPIDEHVGEQVTKAQYAGIEAALNYCSAQLRWRQAPQSEKGGKARVELAAAFDELRDLVLGNGDHEIADRSDPEGTVHRLTAPFNDLLEEMLPLAH